MVTLSRENCRVVVVAKLKNCCVPISVNNYYFVIIIARRGLVLRHVCAGHSSGTSGPGVGQVSRLPLVPGPHHQPQDAAHRYRTNRFQYFSPLFPPNFFLFSFIVTGAQKEQTVENYPKNLDCCESFRARIVSSGS